MTMNEEIRAAALEIVSERGLINLERAEICRAVGIPPGSFHHHAGCTFREFLEQLRAEGHTGPSDAPVTKARTSPEARRRQILTAAVAVSHDVGFNKLALKNVSERADVSPSLVTAHFKTIGNLQDEVVKFAVETLDAPIIAQALALQHPDVIGAPDNVRKLGLNYLAL